MSRSCFGAAAIAFVAAVAPFGAAAQTTAPRPKVFSTTTNALGVDYVPDQQGGLTPIKDTLHMQFVTGLSSMSSSNGPAARATVADPGNGVTQGPANACPVVSGFLPSAALQPIFDACVNAKWPFMAQADGFTPDKSTEGSLGFGEPTGQLNGEGGAAHARIATDGTSSTDSTMSGLKIAPLPGASTGGLPLPAQVSAAITAANGGKPPDTALFTVGSIQATTANLFDGAAAVSHAESRVNGVRLIGGLMTIDSITSIADVHFTVGGTAVGTSSTVVQGARLLGQPVKIDDKGVHPDGNSSVGTDLLKASGLSIQLVGATNGPDDKGFMTAASQGVVIDYTHDVNTGLTLPPPPPNPITQTPPSLNGTYFVRYNLASVASRAFARNLTFGSGASSGSGGVTQAFTTTPPAGSAPASGFTGGTVSAPAQSLAPSTDIGGGSSDVGFLGVNFDLRWLYL
ncbi:MAG TPA: choice-of-anchor P family protein, partial [Acidimicrobiales bacterium]|nr:choice-of-anchor P family protein [Acidimicrobiales bacterium]